MDYLRLDEAFREYEKAIIQEAKYDASDEDGDFSSYLQLKEAREELIKVLTDLYGK
jgi:hypothetical protein